MLKESGQILLGLILVMVVALGIGLSIVQKSLVDISTSTKIEQSSRAFSAAEAGIEKSLSGDSKQVNFSENNSQAQTINSGLLPAVAALGSRQEALEYPPVSREEVAQIWLADPTSQLPACVGVCYTQPTLDIYWGNSSTDKAALELTLVYYNGANFVSRKWYLDNASASRNPSNGFESVTACGVGYKLAEGGVTYQCKKTIGVLPDALLPAGMILIRARLLYNSTSQPIAVQATGTCGNACSLPPQARKIISIGTSGQTQRRIKVFQENQVVPSYFDYAIFSAGEIKK